MESERRPKRCSLELVNLERSRSIDSKSDYDLKSESDSTRLPKLQNYSVSGASTARPKLESTILGTPTSSTPTERCYYTLAIRVQDIIVPHRDDEREDHVHFQASFSMDGMTNMTKPVRITPGATSGSPDRVNVSSDPILFQAVGSASGSLLVVRLLSANRQKNSEMSEVGMTIVDLSLLSVGRPLDVSCSMVGHDQDAVTSPTVNINLRLYSRRKSFTFSFLKADPVFRRSGYTVRMEGLTSFPRPYKKAGMPAGISYFTLRMLGRVDSTAHCETWRAQDRNGRNYTVKKFLIMDAASRTLFVAELDGFLDSPPHLAVAMLDAFLDGVKVSIVTDNEGGVYLRDALLERGPAPEMVASIILRHVLAFLVHLHDHCARVHNDVDARNVLCLPSGAARVGGLCHSVKQLGRAARFAGPYAHMAPERILGVQCSFPSDIWSVGVLARELALGRAPAPPAAAPDDPHALFAYQQAIVAHPSPSLRGPGGAGAGAGRGGGSSGELQDFADACLHMGIRARWTAAELLRHPFILRYEAFTLPAGSWLTRTAAPAPPRPGPGPPPLPLPVASALPPPGGGGGGAASSGGLGSPRQRPQDLVAAGGGGGMSPLRSPVRDPLRSARPPASARGGPPGPGRSQRRYLTSGD